MAYADYAYYADEYGGGGAEADVAPLLERATDDIDNLTFSRIVAAGWDGLTPFQQGLVRRACCIQADFLLENGDAVDSAVERYAINGVSVEFGNSSLYAVVAGTAVCNRAYDLLKRTGLAALMACPCEVRP